MKNRIKNLFINGLATSEIANIVGCSPSYVSQLAKDEEFRKEVEAGKMAAQLEKTEEDHIDTRYQSLEHKLLTAAENALVTASLGEITRAVEVINKRADMKHARKSPTPQGQINNVQIVSLMLPAHALALESRPAITLNKNQEIIAIAGRALAPMSSTAVKNLFATINDAELIKEL